MMTENYLLEMTILYDSGIRTGSDVFKAIALGAHAVMVGRLFVWGMSHEGEYGCRHVMKSLLAVSSSMRLFQVPETHAFALMSGLGYSDDRRRLSFTQERRVQKSRCLEVQPAWNPDRNGGACKVVEPMSMFDWSVIDRWTEMWFP